VTVLALLALVASPALAAAYQLVSARPDAGGKAAAVSFCRSPNVPIPDNGAGGPGSVSDPLVVAQSLTIQDLNVSIRANHTWSGDLRFTLSNGTTTVTLIDRPGVPASTFGCSGDNYDVTVDDEGPDTPIENQCANLPAISGSAPGGDPPNTSLLAAYNGQDTLGTWTLTAFDNATGDTGTLLEWCLVVNQAASEQPDIFVDPLSLAAAQPPDTTTQQNLTIANNGGADLTWTIVEEPARAGKLAAPLSLIVDDGLGENAIGVGGAQFLWLNRFTPAPSLFPIQLDRVEVMFGYPSATGGINVGELVDIYLYEDADGNPANGATFVASLLNQAVQAVDGSTWSVFNLPAPVSFNGPGDVLIAVVNRTAGVTPSTFPAVIDQTSASQQRSWAGFGAVPGNPPVLPLPTFGIIDSFGASFAGNWLVRGFGQTNAICSNLADVPWLNVSPAGGTTAPAANTSVQVTFDSTGLALGIYNANLCVACNDPDPGPGNGTELVVVPVELTVAGTPAISLTKTVGTVSGTCAATSAISVPAGTTVYYCYTVTNTGNVPLGLHNLTDDQLGTMFAGLNYALLPGNSVDTVAAGLSIPAVINVTTTNTATWTAYNVAPGDGASAQATATVSVVQQPADVTGTKTVTGTFIEGGAITYTIVLSNAGPGEQGDNPGDEFTDVLPASLTATGATASSGTATRVANTVTWNGAIPAGGSVTITITATINPGAGGTQILNQGQISYDGIGDGTNDATRLTDDPGQAGPSNPTAFSVLAAGVIPTTGTFGLVLLLTLLAGAGVLALRRLA
jgi:uncharacterized repeat protein (TIGR01451 family)